MRDFIRMSKYAGMREDLVQAGGGNSSYKQTPERMIIKASGYQLADVGDDKGYAVVNPVIIRSAFENPAIDRLAEKDGKAILSKAFISGERPSIETFLHSISKRYTLHTHPIVVNAFMCRGNGEDVLYDLFPDAVFVPYATPGIELAKIYFKKSLQLNSGFGTGIVFLQNHGLIVHGDNADDVINKTEYITEKLERELKTADMESYHNLTRLWDIGFRKQILWKVTDENVNKAYRNVGIWNHSFCPDCVVFLGSKFLILKDDAAEADVDSFRRKYGDPVVISYRNSLYICADSVKKAMEIQSVLSFSGQVMALNKGEESLFLDDEEKACLLHWDAEKYRKNMR